MSEEEEERQPEEEAPAEESALELPAEPAPEAVLEAPAETGAISRTGSKSSGRGEKAGGGGIKEGGEQDGGGGRGASDHADAVEGGAGGDAAGGDAAGSDAGEDGDPPDGPADGAEEEGVREPQKLNRMQMVNPADLPRSYSTNSPEELLVFEYVENFRRQFVQLYPDRKELLLCPRNECGVEKFICTSVRPTQLEYSDIYDLENCASFVAEHIQYEALMDPVALPMYVPSPTSVLQWQVGDCMDMSIVLASLLIGVGYDAYVVIGYADRTTCIADESRVALPFSSDGVRLLRTVTKQKKDGHGNDAKTESTNDGLYQIPKRPPLDSQFVMTHDKMVRLDEKLFAQSRSIAGTLARGDEEEELPPDELEGQRFHCWVLVRAGKRLMPEDVFVEASTGKVRSIDDASYKGVEAVFNHQNYWVDMQRKPAVQDMTWNLDDFETWEFIFLQSAVVAAGRGGASEGAGASPPGSPLAGAAADKTSASKPEEPVTLQGAEEIHDTDHVLDLPPSWVERLYIDRDKYMERYSSEGKDVKRSVTYRKSRAELFAENSRKDGMVQKLILYSDVARTRVMTITEIFANRRDKLRKRVRHFQKGVNIDHATPESLIEELFDPGRADALQKLEERPSGREMTMFHKATLDGMTKRIEHFTRNRDTKKGNDSLHKVIEYFEGHQDRLTYRSITFDAPEAGSEAAPLKVQIENPKKMCLKFERNPLLDADLDLCKKKFYTGLRPSSKIHLIFHYGPGRITAATRTYITEKNINGDNFEMKPYDVNPFAKPLKYTEQRDEYQRLVAEEKALISEFKTAQREAEKIRETRDKENKDPSLIKSLYVQLQEKKQAEADKPKEEDADAALKYDYLAPYLPKHSKNQALKKHDAEKAKTACLKALKDRLIDRAHIIETRLEEEQAALTKRQVGYQRQDNKGDKDTESEEYEKYVNEAQFKIQILKQRRDRHEDLAKMKFKEMIERLENDPRLK